MSHRQENPEERDFSIYRVRCLPANKVYIGLTSWPIDRRWKHHVWAALSGRNRGVLARCIRMYGAASFTIEKLKEVKGALLAQQSERETIIVHNCMAPHGMNMTTGGELILGIVKSEETRKRIAENNRGRKTSLETIAKQSMAAKGRVRTPEHCANISAAKKGQKPAPHTIAASVAARLGIPLTEEHKAKGATANRGKVRSAETRAKLSEARRRSATARLLKKAQLAGTA